MKLIIFFISRTKHIYTKPLTASKSILKIKLMSRWTLFENLFTSAVICKQRLLHENEIVQCIKNYKCYDVNQGYFRKPSQGSTKARKNYFQLF